MNLRRGMQGSSSQLQWEKVMVWMVSKKYSLLICPDWGLEILGRGGSGYPGYCLAWRESCSTAGCAREISYFHWISGRTSFYKPCPAGPRDGKVQCWQGYQVQGEAQVFFLSLLHLTLFLTRGGGKNAFGHLMGLIVQNPTLRETCLWSLNSSLSVTVTLTSTNLCILVAKRHIPCTYLIYFM